MPWPGWPLSCPLQVTPISFHHHQLTERESHQDGSSSQVALTFMVVIPRR